MDENQKPQNELPTSTDESSLRDPVPESSLDEPQEPTPTAAPAEPAPSNSPSTPVLPQVTGANLEVDRKKKIRSTALVVLLLVCLASAIRGWTYEMASSQTPKATASPKASVAPQAASSVPSRLFDASGDTSGLAVGYVAKTLAGAGTNWFVPTADAAQQSYQTAVFYTKPVDSVNQIFALDVSTKTSSQLTSGTSAASDPVFSSVSQNLAYESPYAAASTSSGRCDLDVKNLTNGATIKIASSTTNVCYTPIAWSPDGTKLLYASVDNVLSASDWGLVRLYVYQAGQPAAELKAPTGNNSLEGMADAIWTDANTVEARFENKQQVGGSIVSQQLYTISVKTQDTTPLTSPIDGDLATIQLAGTDQYFQTSTPAAAVAVVPGSGPGAGVKQAVSGTSGAASYLLQLNSQSAVTSVIFVTGQPGEQNAMKIESVPKAGGTAKTVFTPAGFSAYLLGWAGNYNETLYVAVASGQSDIRMYNLQTKTDTDLVPGLSLVQ